jgi:DNA-directed RNA polymerase subunit M/transcription elongation factor TFIIS
MERTIAKSKKVKYICQYCGHREAEAETRLIFAHMRTQHPHLWGEIQRQVQEENRKFRIEDNQQLHDEECIRCPRCAGRGKLFINVKGQERIPGEDYVERQ